MIISVIIHMLHLASDVIGFATVRIIIGALGIESAYNDVLNGTEWKRVWLFF